jgi:hypothetical protein
LNIGNVCTLSIEVVKCILEEHFLGKKPCEVESLGSTMESLSILLNINNRSKIIKNKNYYIIGDVFNYVDCKRETFGVKYIRLQVDKHQILMELAFFPFLFPHDNGAYDGNTSFSEYTYIIKCLVFSLHSQYISLSCC